MIPLSNALLVPIFLMVGLAALTGGAYYLLILDLVLSVLLAGTWDIGGAYLDSSDLMYFFLAVTLVATRSGTSTRGTVKIPHLHLWLVIGTLLSIAYVNAPANQDRLGDPLRAGYQLYRYCWKPILYYAFGALVIRRDLRRIRTLSLTILVVGLLAASSGISQGLSGNLAKGVFGHKNAYAASLIAPGLVGLALALARSKRLWLSFTSAATAIIWLGLLLSGSRGGLLAAILATAFMFAKVFPYSGGRARLVRLAAAVALAITVGVIALPEIRSSAGIGLIGELEKGAEVGNLRWRTQKQWPHFIAIIKKNPWLGTGRDIDPSLRTVTGAIAPHNGYLSIMLVSGIPACLAYFGLALITARDGARLFRNRTLTNHDRILVLGLSCAVLGLMVHNLADSIFARDLPVKIFWLMCGVLGGARYNFRSGPQRSVVQTRRRPSLQNHRADHVVPPLPAM